MAAEQHLDFQMITEMQMRQWVEANPGRTNDHDSKGNTPLFVAAVHHASVQLVLWLVKEKGADVNVQSVRGASSSPPPAPLQCRLTCKAE
jgi:hypothetical protein